MRLALSLITSATTLFAVWVSARSVRLSWKVSLANQAVWFLFIATFDAWGLLPLNLALAGMFAFNLRRGECPTSAK